MRGGEVLDIDEAAFLGAVAVDSQRLTPQRAQEERGDDEVAAHARPERNSVAQHGVRAAEQRRVVATEHLGRDLLRHVQVAVGLEVEWCRLVDDVAVRRRVHPYRARDDDAAGVGTTARLEHARDAERVERDASRRVGDDVVHVGHGREVEDGLGVLQRVGHRVLVEHVDVGPLDVGLHRRLRVDHAHLVPRAEERIDDVRPHEARAAGDRDQFVAQRGLISVSAVARDATT